MRDVAFVETMTAGLVVEQLVGQTVLNRLPTAGLIDRRQFDAAELLRATWYQPGFCGAGASWYEGARGEWRKRVAQQVRADDRTARGVLAFL